MECKRIMIYFSAYENGMKTRPAGYAAVFIRGELCDVQLYYRGIPGEKKGGLQPVYTFLDGTVVQGMELTLGEGMATAGFRTGRRDFLQSGKGFEELESIYLDGVKEGICGGRVDGQDLTETAYTLPDSTGEVNIPEVALESSFPQDMEVTGEKKPVPESWSLAQCLEHFPEMKLPFDGMRRKCCRMTPEELCRLPPEWHGLKENHFLLHGYYEYHHLLLAKLACRYGERYAIGVPGEFCYRNQYMAENFGFYDFAPLEPGRRRGGSFGYWYCYLE